MLLEQQHNKLQWAKNEIYSLFHNQDSAINLNATLDTETFFTNDTSFGLLLNKHFQKNPTSSSFEIASKNMNLEEENLKIQSSPVDSDILKKSSDSRKNRDQILSPKEEFLIYFAETIFEIHNPSSNVFRDQELIKDFLSESGFETQQEFLNSEISITAKERYDSIIFPIQISKVTIPADSSLLPSESPSKEEFARVTEELARVKEELAAAQEAKKAATETTVKLEQQLEQELLDHKQTDKELAKIKEELRATRESQIAELAKAQEQIRAAQEQTMAAQAQSQNTLTQLLQLQNPFGFGQTTSTGYDIEQGIRETFASYLSASLTIFGNKVRRHDVSSSLGQCNGLIGSSKLKSEFFTLADADIFMSVFSPTFRSLVKDGTDIYKIRDNINANTDLGNKARECLGELTTNLTPDNSTLFESLIRNTQKMDELKGVKTVAISGAPSGNPTQAQLQQLLQTLIQGQQI